MSFEASASPTITTGLHPPSPAFIDIFQVHPIWLHRCDSTTHPASGASSNARADTSAEENMPLQPSLHGFSGQPSGIGTHKAPLVATLLSSPNDYHLPLLVKERISSTFLLILKIHTYISFIFKRLFSAILHASCGSPVPYDDAPPGYSPPAVGYRHHAAPPAYSSVVNLDVSGRLPTFEEATRESSSSHTAGHQEHPQTFDGSHEYAHLAVNHIETSVRYFGPGELAIVIPAFNIHPDYPDYSDHPSIHFHYPSPLPITVYRTIRTTQYLRCYFEIRPAATETSALGTFRVLGFLEVLMIDGKAKFGSSKVTLELEEHPQLDNWMRIGPNQNLHFVNPDPNDHLGAGLVVEWNERLSGIPMPKLTPQW
ncbi:hypothetical protein F5880DRAFT_1512309 [Lentinula raphanica]|nr:hypothetical protein F5880DRAFT_1512309 [Lentinula raphanica]